MAFSVGALTDYVDQHSMELIGKLIFEGDSTKLFQKQAGVVGKVAINYFDIDPALVCNGFCATFADTGTTTFNQKTITVSDIKTEGSWCVNTLQKKWMGENIKGVYGDSLVPFEQKLVDQLVGRVLEKKEILVWMGATGSGDCLLGIYYQLSGDSARVNTGTTAITASNVEGQIDAMAKKLPVRLQNRDDLYLFVSPEVHTIYLQALRNSNYFHINPLDFNNMDEIVINWVGPKITLKRTYGLQGTNYMVLTPLINLYHAFDGVSDDEKVEVWFERIYDQILYRIKFRMGITYWLADYCVTNF